jgi:hypothetical protein
MKCCGRGGDVFGATRQISTLCFIAVTNSPTSCPERVICAILGTIPESTSCSARICDYHEAKRLLAEATSVGNKESPFILGRPKDGQCSGGIRGNGTCQPIVRLDIVSGSWLRLTLAATAELHQASPYRSERFILNAWPPRHLHLQQ